MSVLFTGLRQALLFLGVPTAANLRLLTAFLSHLHLLQNKKWKRNLLLLMSLIESHCLYSLGCDYSVRKSLLRGHVWEFSSITASLVVHTKEQAIFCLPFNWRAALQLRCLSSSRSPALSFLPCSKAIPLLVPLSSKAKVSVPALTCQH